MERPERLWVHTWNRWVVVLALGAAMLLSPMPSATGGNPSTPDELLDGARVELLSMLMALQARTDAAVEATISELQATSQVDSRSSVHFKICSSAMTRIEKDSAKTVQQMLRIINRTIIRLERMGAAQEFIDQGHGLEIYSDSAESRPYHATLDIFEPLGDAVGYVF